MAHIGGGVFGVQQTVGDAIVPLHGDCDERGADVALTLHGQEDVSGFCATVEHREVVKTRDVLNSDVGVVPFQIVPQGIVYARIPAWDHHQHFARKVARADAFFICQTVFPRDGDHFAVSAERLEFTHGKPCAGVAHADQKIGFLAQSADFGENPVAVVLTGPDGGGSRERTR